MVVERIAPNLRAANAADGGTFFTHVLGLECAMELDFIRTYRGASGGLLNVVSADPSGLHPDYWVGVDDVDACHARALAQGLAIVYGPVDEPWGIRRFFVRDPLGTVANVAQHRGTAA